MLLHYNHGFIHFVCGNDLLLVFISTEDGYDTLYHELEALINEK